jgi:hypothetical protein
MRRLIFWAVVIAAVVGLILLFTSGSSGSAEDRLEDVKHTIEDAGEQIGDLAGEAGDKAEEAIQDGKRLIEDLTD